MIVFNDGFPALPWLPIQLGFHLPFHLHAENKIDKKKA